MLLSIFTYICFFGIPLLILALWILSMCMYFPAKKKEKEQPGSVEPAKLKENRIMFIISSVLAGVLLPIVVGFMALMFMAVAFM